MVLIRSGGSIAHDHGLLRDQQAVATASAPQFRPALALLATVIGVHDNGAVLLDAGRRDCSFDFGLPVPLQLWREDTVADSTCGETPATNAVRPACAACRGNVHCAPTVGDTVVLRTSHPCTSFDRWRDIVEIDGPIQSSSTIAGLVRTYFWSQTTHRSLRKGLG